MNRYIAFLRAINVGGHTVKNDRLRDLFQELGFNDVETFIASGNVIFRSTETDKDALESRIETHLSASLGYDVATFLRTDVEVTAITNHKAFDETNLAESKALNIGFLKQTLNLKAIAGLMSLTNEIDNFFTSGREVYWLCKVKQSESKFNNKLFEKTLNIRTTFRGIRTIERLAAKYPPALK